MKKERWCAEETAFLEVARAEVPGGISPRFPDAYGDRRLLRFFRHHKSADKALASIRKYVAWRRENEIDAIRQVVETREPREWPYGDILLERVRVLPCSPSLFDVKGNALCVERYGVYPADSLRDLAPDRYLRWQLHCLEWKSMQLENISLSKEREKWRGVRGWGEIARLCTVFDLAGLTWSHALLPCGFGMVKRLVPLVQKYYPWLQDTTHLINASPWFRNFWGYVKPLLPTHTQTKVHIHAAPVSLETFVQKDHLPRALGGDAVCDDLDDPNRDDEDEALLSPASDTTAVLSPKGQVLLEHLDAGGKIVVYEHGRRGRSLRYLTCGDGMVSLSARRFFGRLPQRRRRLGSSEDIFVAQGSSTTTSSSEGRRTSRRRRTVVFDDDDDDDNDDDKTLAPPPPSSRREAEIRDKAARLPSNFAVVGTDDRTVTLELESPDDALAFASLLS